MADDLTVIKLRKKGFGKAPDFIIEIFEDGRVFYEGFENIELNGKFEKRFESNEFVEILRLIKKADFFGFKDDYSIYEDKTLPRTIISVSIPLKSGKIVSKSVTYFQKDPTIPEELKKIENKILEFIDFNENDLVLKEEKIDENIKKDVLKKEKSLNYNWKKIATVFSITLIILVSFTYVFYFNDFEVLKNTITEKNSEGKNENYVFNKTLSIDKLVTASEIIGLGNYSKKTVFKENDTLFVYSEYSNFSINENGNCNLFLNVFIRIINGTKEYNDYVNIENSNKIEHHWKVILDDSWVPRTYFVVLTITDNINEKSKIETCLFSIDR